MSWHDLGGNFVRLSRCWTWSGVGRLEMQVSGVCSPARVMECGDRQQYTTDAVDGIGYGLLSMLKTTVSDH